LPVDPINKLGDCGDAKFNPLTCWDEKDKEFAGTIPDDLPSDSHIYSYSSEVPYTYHLCTQFETIYNNLPDSCSIQILSNHPPIFTGVNLNGWPKEEFKGYIMASDPDDDLLTWSIDTSIGDWSTWSSAPIIKNTGSNNQINIYAIQSGFTKTYPIIIRVTDSRGLFTKKTYNITINPYAMELSNISDSIIIGQNNSIWTLEGLDANKNPITLIHFNNASFNNSNLTETELNNQGFSINNMILRENYTNIQHTGKYIINVYADDLNVGTQIDSFFNINVINHPPEFSNIQITYLNNTTKNCAGPNITADNCFFEIDNAETAEIQITATDPDIGHIVQYALIDNFEGKLSIDSDTGNITGLENLNFHNADSQTFNIGVRTSDQYCAQSLPNECSNIATFSLKVMPYCSASEPFSPQNFNIAGPITINKTGEKINIGNVIENCSELNATTEIALNGVAKSKAIVFVIDTSYSMEALIEGIPAIDLMKNVLANNATNILDRLYSVATNLPSGYNIFVSFVAFNKNTYLYPSVGLANILDPGELDSLKTEINSYSTDFETNTLKALNEAEIKLDTISDPDIEKNIILLSDGEPLIYQRKKVNGCFDRSCECGLLCYSGSDFGHGCNNAFNYMDSQDNCCNPGRSWCNSEYKCCNDDEWDTCCPSISRCYMFGKCPYWGIYPTECSNPPSFDASVCPCGTTGGICNPSCRTNCGTGFNNQSDFKIAITPQTQCLSGESGTCTNNSDCHIDSCQYCANTTGSEIGPCSLKENVDTEIQAIKDKNIKIYSIYYDTGSTSGDQNIINMCNWSNETDCSACPSNPCGGSYAFFGDDIDILFDNILKEILNKPNSISINGMPVEDSFPFNIITPNHTISLNSILSCGMNDVFLEFLFSGQGSININNININYCPKLLHYYPYGVKKWNPGHYILPTSEEDLNEIELILANSENHIIGIQGYLLWRDLETEKDIYNFSKIEELLEFVKKYDKQLIMQISDSTFKPEEKAVPDYLYEDPIYNGGVQLKIPEPRGEVSRIWDPVVNERFIKLLQELGKKFDSEDNFEGIVFEESALGIDTKNTPDFSWEAYANGLISRNKAATEAFPNSIVIQYMNWGPDEFLNYVIQNLYQVGAGMGGPDLVPDEGRYPTKARIPAYDYYPLYAGKMPLGTAVQTPNLMRDDINKKGHFTLDGFWDMGLNTLKLNYIFWAFVEQPWYKFSFTNDILPYINEREGNINDDYPENMLNN